MALDNIYYWLARGRINMIATVLRSGLIILDTPQVPQAAKTALNLSNARANWTIDNVTSSADLVTKYASASANTLFVLPQGNLSWGESALTPSGADNVGIVEHASGTTFNSLSGQRLFTFTGTHGRNNFLQVTIANWGKSGTNRDVIRVESNGHSYDDPFRITGGSFSDFGGGIEAIIAIAKGARNICVDRNNFSNTTRAAIRFDASASDVPQNLQDISNNNDWYFTDPIDLDLSYDDATLGALGVDCCICNNDFQSVVSASGSAISTSPGDTFADGSVWLNTRIRIIQNYFKWNSNEIIQIKSSNNTTLQNIIEDSRTSISIRNANFNKICRTLSYGNSQDGSWGAFGGSDNTIEDWYFITNKDGDNRAGRHEVTRWGRRGNGTPLIPVFRNTIRRANLINQVNNNSHVLGIGLRDENASSGSYTNTDHESSTVAIQRPIKDLTLEDVTVVAEAGNCVVYQPGNYDSFTFNSPNGPNTNITCSGLKVRTNGTASAGVNVSLLQSDFETLTGAEPDYLADGLAMVGTFGYGKELL